MGVVAGDGESRGSKDGDGETGGEVMLSGPLRNHGFNLSFD